MEEAKLVTEQEARDQRRSPLLVADLGAAYGAAGRPQEARDCQAELERRSEDRWISPVMLAITPSAIGDVDRSARFLEQAFDERDPFLTAVRSWPTLKGVCRTERVRALWRKMRLTEAET